MKVDYYIEHYLPQMEGWCTPQKARDLANVVADREPGLAVEIGVFGGRSLFAIALAMSEAGVGTVWGIDPWSVSAAIEGDVGKDNHEWWSQKVNLEEIYRGFLGDVLELGVSNNCRFVRERSEIAVRLFENKSISLFHQDSNHSELVSCRDIELWHPKLTDNAAWIMDDTDWSSQTKAMTMLRERGFKPFIDGGTYQILKR